VAIPDANQKRRRESTLRRDLALVRADGVSFSLMVGIGETYLAAFALALGNSDVASGLLSALPMLAGGVLQLIAPSAMHRASSHRSWVMLWAGLQAASFLPLVLAALIGAAPIALLFACAFLYWGSGLATAPAWNAWMAEIIPARIRSRYFGARQSAAQIGVLVGLIAGGGLLQLFGSDARAFAILFGFAFVCRAISVTVISRQSLPASGRRPQGARARDLLRVAWRSQSRGVVLSILICNAAVNLASPFFTPYLLVQGHLRYGEYMALLAANFLGKIAVYPLLGRIARRAGVRQLMAVGAIGIAPLPLLWTLSGSILYLFAVQGCAGMFWAAFELSILLSFLDVPDDRERTALLATYHFLNTAAVGAASLIGGATLAALGQDRDAYVWVFAASSLGRAIGLALLLARARRGMIEEIPALRILGVRPWGEAIIRPVVATIGLARKIRGPRSDDGEP
jgi:MFS family permease